MADRIQLSTDWYHKKILEMGEYDFLIGPSHFPSDVKDAESNFSSIAFGVLLRLERRNRKLTVEMLANTLNIDSDEIRNIEHNPSYRAKPRTILGISKYFELPTKEVMKLAGAVASNDEVFTNSVMRFAARSDNMGALSREERQLLNQFVEFLRDNTSKEHS